MNDPNGQYYGRDKIFLYGEYSYSLNFVIEN